MQTTAYFTILLKTFRNRSLKTAQLAHALIHVRDLLPNGHPLEDWCDSVAHGGRDRGTMHLQATGLWDEIGSSFWFLNTLGEDMCHERMRPIPAHLFKTAIQRIKDQQQTIRSEHPRELEARLRYLYKPVTENGVITKYCLLNQSESLHECEHQAISDLIATLLSDAISLEIPSGESLMRLLNEQIRQHTNEQLQSEELSLFLLPHFLALFHRTRVLLEANTFNLENQSLPSGNLRVLPIQNRDAIDSEASDEGKPVHATLLVDLNQHESDLGLVSLGLNLAFHPEGRITEHYQNSSEIHQQRAALLTRVWRYLRHD